MNSQEIDRGRSRIRQGFLSYSHADADLAGRIQREWQSIGRTRLRRPRLRLFLDATDLEAAPVLTDAIVGHIEQSEYLLVLCSPEAATSTWVDLEISRWVETHPGDPYLLLARGELVWDEDANGFDLERSTALPPALAAQFVDVPRWADLRGTDGVSAPPADGEDVRSKLAEVAAPVLETTKRELLAAETRQYRSTVRLVTAAAVLFGLVAVIAAVAGVVARREASEANLQRAQAESAALASRAQLVYEENPSAALVLAAEAALVAPTDQAQLAMLDVGARSATLGATIWRADDRLQGVNAIEIIPEDSLVYVAYATEPSPSPYRFDRMGNGVLIPVAPAHDANVIALSHHRQADQIISVDLSGVAVRWEPGAEEPSEIVSFADTDLGLAAFSADGSWLAVVGVDLMLRVFDTASLRESIAHPLSDSAVHQIAVADDGTVVVGYQPGTLEVWAGGITSASAPVAWTTASGVASVSISPDGQLVAVGGANGTVVIFERNGKPVYDIPPVGHQGRVVAVKAAETLSGVAFWSAGSDGSLLGWSGGNIQVAGPLTHLHGGQLAAMAISGGGRLVATAGLSGAVQLLPVGQKTGPLYTGTPHSRPALGATSGGSGSTLVLAQVGGSLLRVDDGPDGPVFTPTDIVLDDDLLLAGLVLSREDRYVAAGWRDGRIELWDLETGARVGRHDGASLVTGMVFSAESTELLVAFQDSNAVHRFGVVGLDELGRMESGLPEPAPVVEIGLKTLALSDDGSTLLAGSGLQGRLIRWRDGEATVYERGLSRLATQRIAFTPDGRRAAIGLSDGRIQVWDVDEGETLGRPLDALQGEFHFLDFLDGERLVSGGNGGTVRFWRLLPDGSATPLSAVVPAHGGDLIGAAVVDSTERLLTSSVGSTVVWNLDVDQWPHLLCQRAGRDLTPEEWSEYVGSRPFRPTCSELLAND